MRRVDFFIVGQPKSGTTALAQFLSEHPEVCMAKPKEPEYFATDIMRESDKHYGSQKYMMIRTAEDYARCFSHCTEEKLLGEATATYLRSKEAAKNIYRYNKNAKIIMILRNPVDFMYSMHMQYLNSAIETEEDFERAIKLETNRKMGKNLPKKVRYPSALYYTEQAKYYQHIKRFLDLFPRRQVLILTNEEFKKDNEAVFEQVLDFLDINSRFKPEFKEVHKSKKPRSKLLNNLMHTPIVWKTMHGVLSPNQFTKISAIMHRLVLKEQSRKKLDPKLRSELEKRMIEDVKRTSRLINRDLTKEWGMDGDS